MIRALRFLASTSPEERAEAYGHSAWALALVAAFVVMFAAITPANAASGTGLSSLRDGAPAGLHQRLQSHFAKEVR